MQRLFLKQNSLLAHVIRGEIFRTCFQIPLRFAGMDETNLKNAVRFMRLELACKSNELSSGYPTRTLSKKRKRNTEVTRRRRKSMYAIKGRLICRYDLYVVVQVNIVKINLQEQDIYTDTKI